MYGKVEESSVDRMGLYKERLSACTTAWVSEVASVWSFEKTEGSTSESLWIMSHQRHKTQKNVEQNPSKTGLI